MLQLAWWCEGTRLPEAGGVMDQDYSVMVQMMSAKNTYHAVLKAYPSSPEDIHNLTVTERRILRHLLDEGLWRM